MNKSFKVNKPASQSHYAYADSKGYCQLGNNSSLLCSERR